MQVVLSDAKRDIPKVSQRLSFIEVESHWFLRQKVFKGRLDVFKTAYLLVFRETERRALLRRCFFLQNGNIYLFAMESINLHLIVILNFVSFQFLGVLQKRRWDRFAVAAEEIHKWIQARWVAG